jgi:formylglycine-generating enzyme required for sulfatase activity
MYTKSVYPPRGDIDGSGVVFRVPVEPAGCPGIVSRVVRGGSWNNNPANARAANRNHNHPHNQNDNLGFRLVCARHIPLH